MGKEKEKKMFKKKLQEQPLGYWEEKSYMMAIPKEEEANLFQNAIARLEKEKECKVQEMNYDVNGVVTAKISYEKETYEIGLYLGGVSVPPYYLHQNFLFTEEEKNALQNAKCAITIFMKYKGNVKKCFHLQLKIACIMVPNLLGLLDESAEKMLPAKWVQMAASSQIPPSSKDLFHVHAVNDKKKGVWLHSHGLCRCGISELEILDSSEEHYEQHFNLLKTYAMFLLDHPGFDPSQGAYIGCLVNGSPVVATCVPWVEGLKEYKKLKLGGEKDRQSGHNTKTSIIFLYTSEEEEKNHMLRKVSIYDDLWKENPLFFYSDEETERMKNLARERFSYVQENFKKDEIPVLIKIGLPLKEKGKFEHIWFELLEIKDKKFKAKLTQEPYDVSNMHTGDEAWFTLDDVTDWIIYTKSFAVNPDNAYLLEK